ncbi:hypothetical protein KIPB_011029, partial [Kipferlia bialata]|eukprot:g11029.t1
MSSSDQAQRPGGRDLESPLGDYANTSLMASPTQGTQRQERGAYLSRFANSPTGQLGNQAMENSASPTVQSRAGATSPWPRGAVVRSFVGPDVGSPSRPRGKAPLSVRRTPGLRNTGPLRATPIRRTLGGSTLQGQVDETILTHMADPRVLVPFDARP